MSAADSSDVGTEPLEARARTLLDGGGYHLIGGGRVHDAQAGQIEVFDPSTGRSVGALGAAGEATVDDAVRSCHGAQRAWHALGSYKRMRILQELADLIEDHVDILAELEAFDSGNPVSAMRADIRLGVESLRYLSALGVSLRGETVESDPRRLHYTQLQPYGVVARIVPFNHPAMFFIGKAAAPLVTGNGLVIKPPEQAPLTALYLSDLFAQVLPAGIVSVIQGDGATGDLLVRHPDIKRIAFTGSVHSGMRIQASAASVGIKQVTMELGGKNPMIVCPDADLDRAVDAAVSGMNLTVCQGQSCGSNSRILVHSSLLSEYRRRVVERLSNLRVGIAYDDETEMGPLISRQHLERVLGYIDEARGDGIEVAVGGGRPSHLDGGYFVEPTLLVGAPATARVSTEEVFGPVISLTEWDDLDTAVERANAVDFGLTASIWTSDVDTAHGVAGRLRAGYVWINEHGAHYKGAPFGGFKASGNTREGSIDELLSYCEVQAVHLEHSHGR